MKQQNNKPKITQTKERELTHEENMELMKYYPYQRNYLAMMLKKGVSLEEALLKLEKLEDSFGL